MFQHGDIEDRLDDIQMSLGTIAILLARLVARETGESADHVMSDVVEELNKSAVDDDDDTDEDECAFQRRAEIHRGLYGVELSRFERH